MEKSRVDCTFTHLSKRFGADFARVRFNFTVTQHVCRQVRMLFEGFTTLLAAVRLRPIRRVIQHVYPQVLFCAIYFRTQVAFPLLDVIF